MGFLNNKKEFNYFAHFCQVGELAAEMAGKLKEYLADFRADKLVDFLSQMHILENRADMIKHEISEQLIHEFMPPIDREDISDLAQRLDDIVDSVEDVIRKIYMFNIQHIEEDALEFASLLSESCNSFNLLLKEFPNFKKSKELKNYIIEINTIENKGDTLHAESIRRLFTKNFTPSEQIAWTKVFDTFETALDACEHTADVIESVVSKNS